MPTFRVPTLWSVDTIRTFEVEAETREGAGDVVDEMCRDGTWLAEEYDEVSGSEVYDEVLDAQEI